jgi:hypothetical protein
MHESLPDVYRKETKDKYEIEVFACKGRGVFTLMSREYGSVGKRTRLFTGSIDDCQRLKEAYLKTGQYVDFTNESLNEELTEEEAKALFDTD